MPVFTSDVVDAVLAHMNDDHRDDNVLIVRAFAGRHADTAVMSDLDGRGGTWRYSFEGEEHELHLPWSEELTERPDDPARDRGALRRRVHAARRGAATALSPSVERPTSSDHRSHHENVPEPPAGDRLRNRLCPDRHRRASSSPRASGSSTPRAACCSGSSRSTCFHNVAHVVIGAALLIAGLSGARPAKTVNGGHRRGVPGARPHRPVRRGQRVQHPGHQRRRQRAALRQRRPPAGRRPRRRARNEGGDGPT